MRDSKVPKPDSSLVAYQDSRTHAARQHWGPSEAFNSGQAREREQPPRSGHPSQYAPAGEHYTTAPAPAYAPSHPAGYPVQQASYTAPRTQPDPYAYAPPGREHPGYPPQQQYAGYSQPAAQDAYRAAPPPPTHGYAAPRYFGYFDNHYLVYR